jgi:hypothetical protein
MRSRRLRYRLFAASVAIAVFALDGVAIVYGSQETSAACGAITVVLFLVGVVVCFVRVLGADTSFR